MNENEEKKELEESIKQEEDVTREINLDDLYDGAVNDTVIIDPVSNSELLLHEKKGKHTALGVILSLIVLLVLYFVSTKTNLIKTDVSVEPKPTTTKAIEEKVIKIKKETLNCKYESESDTDKMTITFVANGINNEVNDTEFNYSMVLINDETSSALLTSMQEEYEELYIKNMSLLGSTITFEKNEKGFTFISKSNYGSDLEQFEIAENKTVMFKSPHKEDKMSALTDSYKELGYTCDLISIEDKENE